MKLINLHWNEIDAENGMVIIGIAPIEEHGTHMPIGVDYYMTQKWVEAVSSKLENNDGLNIYTLPTIPLGCADIKGFAGNIHVSQKLVYSVILQVASSIANWGIKNIIIISAHADPKHQIAIEEACAKINKKYDVTAFSPMGAIFSGDVENSLVEHDDLVIKKLAKYPNDFHAGWIETSMMMYYDNDSVAKDYKNLKDIAIKEREMINTRLVNKKIAGSGHIGYPRVADREVGKKLHDNMIDAIYNGIKCFVNRTGYEKYQHHSLYNIPFLRVKKFRR